MPTEISHFNRNEIKDNYRLACQVKVKGDMEVKIPDEIFSNTTNNKIIIENTKTDDIIVIFNIIIYLLSLPLFTVAIPVVNAFKMK